MYRPLSSQHILHHTHKTPFYPNLTLLLQSSTTLSLVPNTRLHLPLQLTSLSKQLSRLILNKAAVMAHPQQGVLLQEGLQDGLQVLLLQQVLFYRSLMITKMMNCNIYIKRHYTFHYLQEVFKSLEILVISLFQRRTKTSRRLIFVQVGL